MQKWEYNIASFTAPTGDYVALNRKMDEYGQEGWELLSSTYAVDEDIEGFVCVFKRPSATESEFIEPTVRSLRG